MINNITFVIISFKLPETLPKVVDKLASQIPATCEIIIYASSSSKDYLNDFESYDFPCKILIYSSSIPETIGQARISSLEIASNDKVYFIDDDCIPALNFWANLNSTLNKYKNIAMLFGSRFSLKDKLVGSLVRSIDLLTSSKRRHKEVLIMDLKNGHSQISCVGGNMMISKKLLFEEPITSTSFETLPFEDVDLQLRLLKKGSVVVFSPNIWVEHNHPLTFKDALIKAIRSGRGAAVCSNEHGYLFKLVSRWSNPYKVLIKDMFLPFTYRKICKQQNEYITGNPLNLITWFCLILRDIILCFSYSMNRIKLLVVPAK